MLRIWSLFQASGLLIRLARLVGVIAQNDLHEFRSQTVFPHDIRAVASKAAAQTTRISAAWW